MLATSVSGTTNCQRSVLQRGVVAHFDRCIETVHINVDNFSRSIVGVYVHGRQFVQLSLILIGQRNICQMHVGDEVFILATTSNGYAI